MDLSKIYSEVYAVLNVLGNEYINKIPSTIYQYIVDEKDNSVQMCYDVNKTIDEQKISEETLMFISYLNLQYWCSEDEKQELLKKYKQNDERIEKELKEKYNVDNLFKNRQNYQQKEESQLIEYKPKNYLKVLIEKVIKVICFWKR